MQESSLRYLQQYVIDHGVILGRMVDAVVDKGVSDFPILVFSDSDVEIGLDISDPDSTKPLFLRISTLEEFSTKGMVAEDKIDGFKQAYKSPELFYCIFAIKDNQGNFIFAPR